MSNQKKTMLTSLPTFKFDSSLQKRKKQVAYVNYTLNEFKELSQILGDFIFVDNCKFQQCFVMFFMFANWNIVGSKLFFHWSAHVELGYRRKKTDKQKNLIKTDIKHWHQIHILSFELLELCLKMLSPEFA